MGPEVGEAAAIKAIAEAADVEGWVSEGQPDDLGVTVGEGATSGFPNDVGDLGGFVEDDEKALALVVEALPRGGIGTVPRGLVDAPGLVSSGVFGEELGCGEGVELTREEAEIEPFAELSPGFGFELSFGIGSDTLRSKLLG